MLDAMYSSENILTMEVKIMETENLIMYVLILTFSLSVPMACRADDWSKADTTRQMVYTALMTVDMLTTMDISNHDDIQEAGVATRQILGDNPETLPTIGYFAAVATLNYYVAKNLPAGKWRTGWQTGSSVLAGSYVINNWRLGLRPEW